MSLALHIARRYLFSKKSTNAINIISGISGLGIFISSAALIIILSVFNGFEALVLDSYHSFTPDIKIIPKHGKTMLVDSSLLKQLNAVEGVAGVVQSLEEKALLNYNDQQCIASVKGLSPNFIQYNRGLDSSMIAGNLLLQADSINYALLGSGIRYGLSVNVETGFIPLAIYSPKKQLGTSINPIEEFNRMNIVPGGTFSVQQEFDSKYVLVPLRFARSLFGDPNGLSALEISINTAGEMQAVKEAVTALVAGKDMDVQDKYEQNEVLYKILNSERWAVYLILTFITIIAICNIMGSLTMLLIDKKKDIAIMQSMGASFSLIRSIYFLEGVLIATIASGAGLLAGGLFCFLQQQFGFITAGNAQGTLVNAYPVLMHWKDFVLVILTVMGISGVATFIATQFGLSKLASIREQLAE